MNSRNVNNEKKKTSDLPIVLLSLLILAVIFIGAGTLVSKMIPGDFSLHLPTGSQTVNEDSTQSVELNLVNRTYLSDDNATLSFDEDHYYFHAEDLLLTGNYEHTDNGYTLYSDYGDNWFGMKDNQVTLEIPNRATYVFTSNFAGVDTLAKYCGTFEGSAYDSGCYGTIKVGENNWAYYDVYNNKEYYWHGNYNVINDEKIELIRDDQSNATLIMEYIGNDQWKVYSNNFGWNEETYTLKTQLVNLSTYQ